VRSTGSRPEDGSAVRIVGLDGLDLLGEPVDAVDPTLRHEERKDT
jgi:hypothetical protein